MHFPTSMIKLATPRLSLYHAIQWESFSGKGDCCIHSGLDTSISHQVAIREKDSESYYVQAYEKTDGDET